MSRDKLLCRQLHTKHLNIYSNNVKVLYGMNNCHRRYLTSAQMHNRSITSSLHNLTRIPIRTYTNLSKDWLPVRNQYTKYRITKPWSSDTTYDDIFLSQPSKDDFHPFTKEIPVFLRFLNLLTTAENRKDDFVKFVQRCDNGLVVEKDVYITKDELLECMWSNGYTENEINAIRFAFPTDYRFHYPELSVLFELEEEDCYRYCLKERASNPEELVELKLKKPQNLISSYGLVFLGCWFGLSNAVLGNAWFFAKTLPFGAVFYMLAAYFQKWIKEYLWKETSALIDKAKQEKEYCELAIYNQLKKYLEDSKCNDYVDNFRTEVIKRMEKYRNALLIRMKTEATRIMNEKLQNLLIYEQNIQNSIQKSMIDELVKLFLEEFKADEKLKNDAIASAVDIVKGDSYSVKRDPLFNFFNNQLSEFQKEKSTSKVVKRCMDGFSRKEDELLSSFTISPEESREVSTLARACKLSDGYDLSLLSKEQFDRLNDLFTTFSERIGYYVPSVEGIGYTDDKVKESINLVRCNYLQEFIRQFD